MEKLIHTGWLTGWLSELNEIVYVVVWVAFTQITRSSYRLRVLNVGEIESEKE